MPHLQPSAFSALVSEPFLPSPDPCVCCRHVCHNHVTLHCPHTHCKVLTCEFCTELTFISISPFSLEFFSMVLLKAAFHICLKGGLLLKLHIKLREWCVHYLCGGWAMAVMCASCVCGCAWKGYIQGDSNKSCNLTYWRSRNEPHR